MLLECHGTGTRVGDPIEVTAAGNVFGVSRPGGIEDRLIVGSVKTNLGHLEGACALPGILKVVAAIEAGAIPPTLGYKNPNPRIDFDKAKARVATQVEPWPENKLKRASVTSAGFGGTNGHCVIDHVHNYVPEYVKPGVVVKRLEELNGSNGTNYTNGTNGVNGDHLNGHDGHTNGHTNGNTNGHTNGHANGHANGHNGSSKTVQHHPIIVAPTTVRTADASTRKLVVLPFSAHNQDSLKANAHVLSRDLHRHSLADVAYTLAAKRSRFTLKAFSIVGQDEAVNADSVLETDLKIFSSPQPLRLGFVFTGQGAQWHAMGAELIEYAVFRDTISYLDYVLSVIPQPSTWKILDVLTGNCEKDFIQAPEISQTVCTALQIGLVDLLASWSVRPSGVTGHSSGEMAAAYAAGYITAAEAITAAYYRGLIVAKNQKEGAMLAVGVSPEKGMELIQKDGVEEKIKIAAINSADSITMSGDSEAVGKMSEKLTEQGVFNRLLRTGGLAYHSHHMLPLGLEYAEAVTAGWQRLNELGINDASQRYPIVPWVSSVHPDKEATMSRDQATASYWRANLESPVRFNAAVSKLLAMEDAGIGALVEIGPHPALKGPVGQIVKSLDKNVPHIGSLKRGESAQKSVVELAGTMFALNAPVDLVAVNAADIIDDGARALAHGCMAIDLPPYQYTYGPINYHESRLSRDYRLRNVPRHDLLGSKIPGTTKLHPQWRNILTLKHLPWLDDHRVPPHVLHPGAAHIVMAMVAAEQAYLEYPDALPITGLTMRNVSIKKTLVVPEDDHGIEIVLSLELEDGATAKTPGWGQFSISSVVRNTDQWTEHCSGRIKVEVADFEGAIPIDTNMDGRAVNAQTWYKRFADMGLQFGPSFQGYSDILADPKKNIASAKLALNTTAGMFPGGESSYPIHPASLDLVIRLGLMACNGGQAETASVQLPIHFNQMKFKYGRLSGREWATGVSRGELRGLRGAYAQLQMLDDTGDVILDVDNMRFTSLNNEQQTLSSGGHAGRAFASPYARLVWRPDIRTFSKEQFSAVLSNKARNEVSFHLKNIFDLAGHANPDLRVLVVNSSSDKEATRAIIETLVGPNRIKRFREFVVSDASKENLSMLREYTPEFSDVKYSVLDISEDPSQQGFQASSFDLVLLLDAVQNVPVLVNCNKLLGKDGKFIIVENSKGKDGAVWEEDLRSAGFVPSVHLAVDGERSTLIISTHAEKENKNTESSSVIHLLHGAKGAPMLLGKLAKAMEKRGISTKTTPIDNVRETLEPNSRVVAFLDGENLLLDADQNRLGLFQHMAANTASMIWLTSCGIVKGRNPDGAFVAGLLRTLGSENPAGEFLSIDVDAEDFAVEEHEADGLLRVLIDQVEALQQATGSEVNRELAWQDGCMWVSRIVPDSNLEGYGDAAGATPDEQAIKSVPLGSQGPIRAVFGTPGILTSLYFRTYTELWQPLPGDWIEVKVEAVGLNWKDLGLCSGRFDQNNLSNEYCGIVSKKGHDVTGLEIGDRVYGMGKGHFGNYTRVPAVMAQKLKPGLDSVEAATMPLVYMTAVYAFDHVARVRKNQKVLIQSASGGLGIAAIQLAKSKGAEVFATAGTAKKAQFLTDEMGIPPNHIFSSRDIADISRMVQATKNDGFDVILSTAQGDLLHESIKALAPLGHLIDVGRLDVTSSKTVALELFQKCASFTSFDLGVLIERDLGLGGELMQSVNEYYQAGLIGPIRPCTVSSISQLDQTLLGFSKGTHIGKMVISYQDPNSIIKLHQSVPLAQFDPGARYILVGGLSGLGRSIVRWMSERGARDMVIWSRSGGSNTSRESLALVEELAANGVKVQLVACDVSNKEQVLQAVQTASADVAVRGIVNFAVSYEDISFDKITQEMFHKGIAAKVVGNKNLHEATASLPLDFFVMTSSLGTVYAFPTQSTYMAANNWMDYFVRYRRRLGLPATTVSLGFINDLGALTQDAVTVNLFVRAKGQTVTGSQVLRALEPAFVSSRGNGEWAGLSQDPLSEANILTGIDPSVLAEMKKEETKANKNASSVAIPRWYHDARVSIMLRALDDAWRNLTGTGGARGAQEMDGADKSPAAQLRREFDIAVTNISMAEGGVEKAKEEQGKTIRFVTEAIRGSVAGMLFIDPSAVNPAETVAEHGIDSLLAAEFRNWLHVAFGKNISMLELMDARTSIHALAQRIVDEAIGA